MEVDIVGIHAMAEARDDVLGMLRMASGEVNRVDDSLSPALETLG